MRDLVRETDGEQDVRRVERAGSTRGPARAADARLIEQDEQRLPFYEPEREIDVVGQTLFAVAVEYGVGYLALYPRYQMVAQLLFVRGAFIERIAGELACLRDAR